MLCKIFLFAWLCGSDVLTPGWHPVDVSLVPIALGETGQVEQVGSLVFNSGWVLTSDDPRFGGISGLDISADGKTLIAVTDQGAWVRATLTYDGNGILSGLTDVAMAPLTDEQGNPLDEKSRGDAEALRVEGPDVLVSFERQHRMWWYQLGDDGLYRFNEAVGPAQELNVLNENGGLEAVSRMLHGATIAFSETGEASNGEGLLGWVDLGGGWEPFTYKAAPGLSVSDATSMPGGNILVLERTWARETGNKIRLARVSVLDLRPGAVVEGEELAFLERPLTVDNFEGVASLIDDQGRTRIFIVSDDNFSSGQRTLLFDFTVAN